jgi:DNA repair exonuclease SbcCD ATPase subunit
MMDRHASRADLELNQTQQMLNWLESERVKDKQIITTLQERTVGQANELTAQAKRIQELESALAAAKATLTKALQFSDMLQQFKDDLLAEMDRREDARQKESREGERLHKAEIESLGRGIIGIRKDLSRIKPVEDELPLRRAEERRLAELISRLTQRVEDLSIRTEERVQSVIYLEEGRRQDAKRMAQLEEIANTQIKRLDLLTSKQTVLEDNISRLSPRIDEIHKRVSDLSKPIEDMRVSEFRRAQEMKTWVEEIEKRTAPIPDHITAFQRLQEQAQINQRYLEEVKGFKERLEGRHAEVAEAQRIADDRAKRQMETFLIEQEKRWQRFTTEAEERWNAHERVHRPITERIEAAEARFMPIYEQLDTLWDIQEAWSKMPLLIAREWSSAYGQLVQQRRTLGRPEPGPLPKRPKRKADLIPGEE